MDRARRIGGLIWVCGGALFQLVWAVFRGIVPGAIPLVVGSACLALAVLLLVDVRPVLRWVGGWVVAVLLALEFGGAVADRFGMLGRPGAPGVSWGSWSEFVDYTQILLGDAAGPGVSAAAAAATGVELLLAVALLSGCRRRWTGKAAAGLLAVYLIAMVSTVGLDEVARYTVPVLIGGALLVSVTTARYVTDGSIDTSRGGAPHHEAPSQGQGVVL